MLHSDLDVSEAFVILQVGAEARCFFFRSHLYQLPGSNSSKATTECSVNFKVARRLGIGGDVVAKGKGLSGGEDQ
jgi:hypothetical protein